MIKSSMKIRLTTFEPMLGMMPSDPEIMVRHIGDKAIKKHPELESEIREEVDSIPKVEGEVERKSTVFPRTEEAEPFFWDYQIKGMFKDACGMLWRAKDTESKKLKAYRKMIDGLLFVSPRRIPIKLPEGAKPYMMERPLRASTPQGERVSIARSECFPAGCVIEFEVLLLSDKLFNALEEWLDYGKLRGLGQWRNSGTGRYTYEILNDK